ncbi:MAG: hypothetical protein JRJ31_22870 [Deltaproteobacteria bacterium]|nr:hypothetical protein [Deltaproteobacteria bacterium]
MLARRGIRIGEDDLTHAVMGLFRYLPPQLWFQEFLRELRKRNPSASSMLEISSSPKVSLWPSYQVPEQWRRSFWRPRPRGAQRPIPKGTICPDALIETDRWVMMVESEYSRDLDAEQLFQQFAICAREYREREFFLLLINKALIRPCFCGVHSERLNKPEALIGPQNSLEEFISKSCTFSLGLRFSEEEVKERLLWANWQSIQGMLANLAFDSKGVFSDIPRSVQEMIERMREDVCALLESQGLIPIGFDAAGYMSELSVHSNIIPQLPVVSPVVKTLSDLEIDANEIPKWQNVFRYCCDP